MKIIFPALAAVALVSGCATAHPPSVSTTSPPRAAAPAYIPPPDRALAQREATATEMKLIIAALRDDARDPDSVQVRKVMVYSGSEGGSESRAFCGEWNAKNAYGGYGGYKEFYGQLTGPQAKPISAETRSIAGGPFTRSRCVHYGVNPWLD